MRLWVLLFLLAVSIVGLVHEKGLLKVNQIEVIMDDVSLNKSPYWNDLLGKIRPRLTEFETKNIWQVPLIKIAGKFQSEAWVNNVTVSREWPQRIRVKVKNKKIKLLLLNSEGRLIPIDEKGEFLPIIQWSQAPSLPLLRGAVLNSQINLRKKMLDFFDQLPESGLFSTKQISDITYNEVDGFIATLVWKSLQVKLGFEPSTLVSLRISQVLEYLQSRNINVRVIDANFSKKVLVKLRNQP
jgi:cell division protein FtsQ